MGRPRSIYRGLQLLERRALRGAPLLARRQVENALLGAVNAAVVDAHMSGRVYASRGEKRSPAEEHRHMIEHAERVASAAFEREMRDWEAAHVR